MAKSGGSGGRKRNVAAGRSDAINTSGGVVGFGDRVRVRLGGVVNTGGKVVGISPRKNTVTFNTYNGSRVTVRTNEILEVSRGK